MRRAAGLALIAVFACGGEKAQPAVSAADVLETKAYFGERADAHPELVPTGWTSGTRATWLDATVERGLEAETDGGVIVALSVTYADDRAEEVEAKLRKKLGSGTECAAVPESAEAGFRPTLWRTTDGGSVTLVRKKRILVVRVERPASAAFEKALAACR